MSKKVALTALICIVLGSSSMITGPVLFGWIDNNIEDSVDEILLIAKDMALPIIDDVIDMINFVETVGLMYDPSPFEQLIQGTNSPLEFLYLLLSPLVDSNLILSWYFDTQYTTLSSTFSASLGAASLGTYSILGISEWAGEDLLYGDAKYNLIRGTDKLPGICSFVYEDMSAYSPEGWWGVLRLYDEAKENASLQKEITDGYGISWYKFEKLILYYRDYYLPEVVPKNLNNPLINIFFPGASGLNKTEMSYYFFLMQWANCMILPSGIDIGQFNIIPGAPSGILGLEAGYPDPTNMAEASMYALWDVNNPYAIVNNEGNRMWHEAIHNDEDKLLLQDEFNLTPHAMDCMMRWEVRLTSSIIPIIGGTILGFDMDLKTWSNSLQTGLTIFGGSLMILGSLTIYGNIRVKRKKKSNLKSVPLKMQIKSQHIKDKMIIRR